jgi:hypothetical protein
VKAIVALIAAVSLAAPPITATAKPTPSPSLSTLLATPTAADYVEDTESPGTPLGQFDAAEYASFLQPDDTSGVESTLQKDGFVAGYAKSWTQQTTGRALVEMVVAFNGGRGARRWLSASETAARADQYYKGAITVSGIDPYFGVHYANPTASGYADVVDFVKGNDFFLVGYVSSAADMGDAAASQSKLQYRFAAEVSIPRSDWPENSASAGGGFDAGKLSAGALAALFLIGIAVGITLMIQRHRRVAALANAAPGPQISPDGGYWWDGGSWRDAAKSVPPDAFRSSDGTLWWDGQAWRPVPKTGA